MEQRSQFKLLTERRFAPFFWTPFFGAFNDNLVKNALVGLVTYQTARFAGEGSLFRGGLVESGTFVAIIGEPVTPAAATPEHLHAAVLRLRGDGR